MTVRILTDSTSDLPPEMAARLGIRVAPIYIHIENRDYVDGVDLQREEFYTNLSNYKDHPTTAVPSPEKIRELYDGLAEEGASDILSIHISGSLSAILDVARSAAAETVSARVTVFDSQQLSLGTGFLVQTAAEMAAQGKSVQEILPVLEDQIKRTRVSAGLNTLVFLRRSGRMNGVISTIGELVQIKPILKMYAGQSSVERVRTRNKMHNRLLEMLHSYAPFEKIAFLHSGALEQVHTLRTAAAGLLSGHQPWIGIINPVLGAHIGPGVVGFAGVSSRPVGG